jgi:peptidoglycan/LPS O-acetylase OafA/YrhL
VARIWPSHIAATLLYILLIGSISYYSLPAGERGWITLAYVTLTHAWVPRAEFITAYNTVSWSISTEFFFYLAFPLLVANWSGTWRTKLLVTMLMTVAIWVLATKLAPGSDRAEDVRGSLAYINPLPRLFEFALGIGLCHWYRQYGTQVTAFLTAWRATAVELATLLIIGLSMWVSHALAVSPTVAAALTKTASLVFATSGFGTFVFAGAIFVFALGAGRISGFLRRRPLVFLGEISFGLYLVHTLFLQYRQLAPGVFDGLSRGTIYGLYWLTGLALATLLHFGIERPCQTLIRNAFSGRPRVNARPYASAIGAFCVVVFCIVVLQPSARDTYAVPAERSASLLQGPIRFLPGYRLDSVELMPDAGKEPKALRFAWTAEDDLSLAKLVAVHLLDASGKMIGQLDFVLETGFRSAVRGDQWSNLVPLTGRDLTHVKAIGVAIYDRRGMSVVAPEHRDRTDWNGQRLLVGMTGSGPAVKMPSEAGAFIGQIRPEDIEGEWKAGDGVARIVSAAGATLSLTTETGLLGSGAIMGDWIDVPGWRVTARLTADRRELRWSNGFVWRRST